MNGKPLPLENGAPLRLRVETLLGCNMVKWLKEIEFIEH
jgi:methionine sulfoxide reductase catalytic subunit